MACSSPVVLLADRFKEGCGGSGEKRRQQLPGRIIGHGHFGDEVAAQQLRQDMRIDLVGFDACVGDGFDLQGVGDDDSCAIASKRAPEGNIDNYLFALAAQSGGSQGGHLPRRARSPPRVSTVPTAMNLRSTNVSSAPLPGRQWSVIHRSISEATFGRQAPVAFIPVSRPLRTPRP